jgi:hypothetical protein
MTATMDFPVVTASYVARTGVRFGGVAVAHVLSAPGIGHVPAVVLAVTVPLSIQDMAAVLFEILTVDEVAAGVDVRETRRVVADALINTGCEGVMGCVREADTAVRTGSDSVVRHWADCVALARAACVGVSR